MSRDLLAVTGATGHLGRLALAALRVRVPADRMVAIVRDPACADPVMRDSARAAVRHGDYDKPDTMRQALAGVARLLFVSSPELDPARRITQHRAVVDAAAAAGVEALVYTSFLPVPPLFDAHAATEEAIAASGIPAYTILRNPFYSDAFVPGKELVHATGGRPLNTAARADLAEAAARALLAAGDSSAARNGRIVTLTGPLWTCAELGAELGIPVREGEVPGAMGFLHGLVRAGLLAAHTNDLAELLERAPATMAEVSRAVAPAA